MVNTTSSKLTQDPLVMVHLSVTLLPDVNPVTVLVGEFAFEMIEPFADPITLHNPVPVTAALAAKVKLPVLHCS